MKKILITGAHGLISQRLSFLLKQKKYETMFLSRKSEDKQCYYWSIDKGEIDKEAIQQADVIIHLAGASVSKRWSSKNKQKIYDSRILSTRLLREYVQKYNPQLSHFISASAIGYYGDTGSNMVNEKSPKGNGFLSDVVCDWEKEITAFNELSVPHSSVRIGLVLSNQGGALSPIIKSMQWNMGAVLGNGKQFVSWIHIDDLCNMFIYLIENQAQGIFNGVSPSPIHHRSFMLAISKTLKRKIVLPNVPSFVLKAIFGEMSSLLLMSCKVSSEKITSLGFQFQYPTLTKALQLMISC